MADEARALEAEMKDTLVTTDVVLSYASKRGYVFDTPLAQEAGIPVDTVARQVPAS